MNFYSFIFGLLCLISVDVILGFIVYTFWKYFDLKYFSKFEVTLLQNEIEYLKKQNQKLHGTGTNNENWGDGYNNLY